MPRKSCRNYSLCVGVPFLAVLIALVAGAIRAQTTGAGVRSTQPAIVSAQKGCSPQLSKPKFASPVTYDAGPAGVHSVAVGDVNGDGKPDLAVANISGVVGVLLGNGDGTFQAPVTYSSGGSATRSVAIGDLNGDGHPDLVVANNGEGTVGVLLGNGDGTFRPAVIYASGASNDARSVVIGDLNGDHLTDLVVANDSSNTVGVLLGNGDGTFQPVATYDSGGARPYAVAVADVNGDGVPDVVVANETAPAYGGIGVLLGRGDGTLEAAKTYSIDGYPDSVAIGDVNGDGYPDVILALAQNDVGVMVGKGDGTFPWHSYYNPGGGTPSSVAIADLNGDGHPDVVVANICEGYGAGGCKYATMGVLLGKGDGTFTYPQVYSTSGSHAFSVAATDVNGDGRPDLLVTNECGINENCAVDSAIDVFLNLTQFPTTTKLTSSPNPSQVNQAVTFAATVTSTAIVADGEIVTFSDTKNVLGTGTTSNGVARFTTSFPKAVSYAIKASYPGDAFHNASVGKVKQVVNKWVTTTALSSSLNPSQFGQAITFTAQVASSGPRPTGTVKFVDGTKSLGAATLSGGIATLTKSTLAVGTHPITAQYPGDAASAKSKSPVLDQVVQ